MGQCGGWSGAKQGAFGGSSAEKITRSRGAHVPNRPWSPIERECSHEESNLKPSDP
jgi:hypothetical protein